MVANTFASISPRLAELLIKKGLRCILLDVAFSKSCGGAVGELFARAIRDDEAQQVLGCEGVRRIKCARKDGRPLLVDGEPVELLVAHRSIVLDDAVALDARPLFGLADIKVTGARF